MNISGVSAAQYQRTAPVSSGSSERVPDKENDHDADDLAGATANNSPVAAASASGVSQLFDKLA